MFKLIFNNLLSSDPLGNEMIFHGRNSYIAALRHQQKAGEIALMRCCHSSALDPQRLCEEN